MFWTIEKITDRIEELRKYRYFNINSIDFFQTLHDKEGEIGQYPPSNGNWSEMKILDRWEGRDTYLWVKTTQFIPNEWKNQTIVGVFDFGNTGGGHNSGFESLLYLNGEPFQGVDSNHLEVFIDNKYAGTNVELCFRLWSGLEGGGEPTNQKHQLKVAFLACLDVQVDDLFYTSKAGMETIQNLDESQPERINLLKLLDRAFHYIDWSTPGNQNFYHSIYKSQEYLTSELDNIAKDHPVTINAIGHTHIDVAWLWRLKHTREKVARSFSTVLRLMERYPDYVFLQTQPQLYDYIKNDYPEIYKQIKKKVQEGRWEPEGAMWVEADCNLPSGESLVRQLLLGTQFFRDEFGKECEYLWLPDVFGYSWALPQILVKSGIKTFMTTKISWSQYNKMPNDTFKWRGIDGTEILTHFITTPDQNSNIYTYNGRITARTVKGIWESYRDKGLNQELILSYGYGDGGGGVNREMLEMRKRLDRMPGLPKVKTGTAGDFFQRLHETIDSTDQYVHTWDGELYLEYHRGTYTSQAYNKRMNRKMELFLRETEWLNVFKVIASQSDWQTYPKEELTESWKIVLRNQFHDIIPGSSIREVYLDSREEYIEAHRLVKNAWSSAADALTSNEKQSYTIFNSASFHRNDVVELDHKESDLLWKGENGKILDSQQTSDGKWLVMLDNVPSLGITTLTYEKGQSDNRSPFKYMNNGVETPYYQIYWDETGQLVDIFDIKNQRHVLSPNTKGNVFQVFEDKPMKHDAWDIDIYYQQKMKEIRSLMNIEIIEDGIVRSVIQFTWQYGNSVIQQKMKVYAKNPRIDFDTFIDWHEREQLLKVAFPVDIRSTEATYDIQYGNVKRPTHWNTSWDYARFESVGHQWVDLSETGYGISLLNDCKYGHDIKDNVIRLTLIKCATHPDVEQDQGEHFFTYSILPHEGDWREANTVKEAWSLNNPLTNQQGRFKELSLFKLTEDNVMIDAVKKAENSNQLIIRLHEYLGARKTIKVLSDFKIKFWQEMDLMERSIQPLRDDPFIFEIKPYEIKTFLVDIGYYS